MPKMTAPPSAKGLSCGGASVAGATVQKASLASPDKEAIPLAGVARPPPGLEVRRPGKLLDAVRPRPAPVLLQHEIGGDARTDQKRADEIEHDRRGDRHFLVREDELAQQREGGGREQEERHPIGGLPHQVPFIGHRERKSRALGIEEDLRHFKVPKREVREQDRQRPSECDESQ